MVAAGEAVAARLAVVDAIDENAARFYAHHGFVPVPEHPLRLHRRLKDVRAASNKPSTPTRNHVADGLAVTRRTRR